MVQVAEFEKKDLEMLLDEYPLARREVRSCSFKLAFQRAVLQLAKVLSKNRAMGVDLSLMEAFVSIRQQKKKAVHDHMRLKEPTRKLLASNLIDLSERTEVIAKDSEAAREQIATEVRALSAKMDAIANAMGIVPKPPAQVEAPAPAAPSSGSWIESLMGTSFKGDEQGAGGVGATNLTA